MSQHRHQPQAAKTDRALIGLPIFTSDDKAIGTVLATGIDEDDHAVLIAEIEGPLGIGDHAVAIPTNMFVRKADRIELTITEVEVRNTLARVRGKR